MDDYAQAHKVPLPEDWYSKQNLPFAIVLGVYAAIQLCSAFLLLVSNRSGKYRSMFFLSLVLALVTLSLGASETILASEYNTFTRTIPKDNNEIPDIMPFY